MAGCNTPASEMTRSSEVASALHTRAPPPNGLVRALAVEMVALLRNVAAIDEQGVPGNERRLRRGEEEHRFRNLLGSAQTLESVEIFDGFARRGVRHEPCSLEHRRYDEAGTHGVHAD